jgi:hypothetical protein
MSMNEHIIRTLGYTAVFVVFVAAAGYFIFTQPNWDQQKNHVGQIIAPRRRRPRRLEARGPTREAALTPQKTPGVSARGCKLRCLG